VFVDHTNRRVLDVLEGRDKELIAKYLRANKDGLFAQLEEVTTDMWDGYVNAAEAVFGETVRVTIDRFHVMKNFQEQLTEARKGSTTACAPSCGGPSACSTSATSACASSTASADLRKPDLRPWRRTVNSLQVL
jgi:transposase